MRRKRPRSSTSALFLHEFQTIASLDLDRNEIIAPLVLPDVGEDQMILNLTSGDLKLIGHGGARQHRFFDRAQRTQTSFNCQIPGVTNSMAGFGGVPRIAIASSELSAHGIDEPCIAGFAGGGYDPVGGREHLLMRTATVSSQGVFLLGIADMATNQWLGLFETDATYGALDVADIGSARLFLSTEFLPAKTADTAGVSGTLAPGEALRFSTGTVPPGVYTFSMTGTGDADLYVRTGSPPTISKFDCRPFRSDSNETCKATLPTSKPIHLMVRGFAGTSTFQLTARSE